MHLLDAAVDKYGVHVVVPAAAFLGCLSYPIVRKVIEIAISVFKNCITWIGDTTFFVRMRSMGCDRCAVHHRHHMNSDTPRPGI